MPKKAQQEDDRVVRVKFWKTSYGEGKKPFSCEAVLIIRPEGWAIEFNASAMRVQKADCHEKAFSERLPGTTIPLN